MRLSSVFAIVLGSSVIALAAGCGEEVVTGAGGGGAGSSSSSSSSGSVTSCVCGAEPAIAKLCPDGSSPAAVCTPSASGCGWEFPACPSPVPPTCASSACGAEPLGMANMKCSDGSVGGPVCEPDASGTCGWAVRSCPPSAADAGAPPVPCSASSCGPTPGAPNLQCADGSIGGPVCMTQTTGTCGWTIRGCPVPVVDGGPSPAVCDVSKCGPQPMIPTTKCWDGSIAGPTGVCLAGSAGTCGWEIKTCPPPPPSTGSCKLDSDCTSGDVCAFKVADACTAVGQCVKAPTAGPMCMAYAAACTCTGTIVNVACTGYPAGMASAPIAYLGTCK